jgi:hypothetical protein
VKFVFEYLSIEVGPDPLHGPSQSRALERRPSTLSQTCLPTTIPPNIGLAFNISLPGRSDTTWSSQSNRLDFQEEQRTSPNSTSLELPLARVISQLSPPQTIISSNSDGRHWPLANEEEAILLRHFVVKLSQWVSSPSPGWHCALLISPYTSQLQ